MRFIDKLNQAIERNNSLLMVGLDPDPNRMSADFMPHAPLAERIKAFCLNIIEQTAPFVCGYKPNSAFFEQAGPAGMAALKEVIAAVPDNLPVLLDAKRGDIGNTAKAYARAAFEDLNADGITLSPYLGADSIAPFVAYEDKMVFVLCHTSNPSAAELQHHGQPELYKHVARVTQQWAGADNLGYVIGATQPEALAAVREIAPDRWILAPGVGAQGGDPAVAMAAGMDAIGSGMIVPVSRAVLYADNPAEAAQKLRDDLNTYRTSVKPAHDNAKIPLVRALYEADCVKFGEFTLASGKTSPVYVDLRRIISFPTLFDQAVSAYITLLPQCGDYELFAAVPYAALPATAALSLWMSVPMIYPRKQAKTHGTKQQVEGAYATGQVAVAVEDVVTSGGSLLQSVAVMEAAGIVLKDILVLVDREQGGRERLAEAGYNLHAVLTLREIVDILTATGDLDEESAARVSAYLNEN